MVLRSVFVLILMGFTSCGDSNSTGESKQLSGKELFHNKCTACHGEDGKLGALGASDLSASTLTNKEISKIIVEGKNGMPPFKHDFTSEETLNEITDFVKSLNQ